MILLFEEYQYEKADDIALIKKCVAEAYLIESKRSPLEGAPVYLTGADLQQLQSPKS